MNQIERECVILSSAWQMIDGMVNWGMFVRIPEGGPTNLTVHTSTHLQLFNILVGDFLSDLRVFKGRAPLSLTPAPQNSRPSDRTFLHYLRQVCADPILGDDASELSAQTEAFASWLEAKTSAKGVNLPSINLVVDVEVSRYCYIKICGDIAKHNLARLDANVGHIRSLLNTSGREIDEETGYLAVEDFFDWFHKDILLGHSSVIAEFLNNIRCAIFEYLRPTYSRSWYPRESAFGDLQMYGYHYPDSCADQLAKAMFWDLMNRVRAEPVTHRFTIHDSFRRLH